MGFDAAALARQVAQAVHSGETLHLQPEECPPDLDAAEDVLFRVAAGLGPAVAWKLGASTTASRAAQGFDRAWSAPFTAAEVLTSPAELAAGPDGTLGLECELVFRLGSDLPVSGALDTATVRDLVASVHAGIEVPASRYSSIGAFGASALVADRGACGWLVVGDALPEWTSASLDDLYACLIVDGGLRGEGSGRDLIKGPIGALCDHLARMRMRGVSQPAGTLVSIGSLAGFWTVKAFETATASFGHQSPMCTAKLFVLPPASLHALDGH